MLIFVGVETPGFDTCRSEARIRGTLQNPPFSNQFKDALSIQFEDTILPKLIRIV